MNCREAQDLLIECVTGMTPPDRRRALLGHLENCPSCRREAEGVEGMVALLRTVPEPRMPEGHWTQFMAALDRRVAQETTGWRRLVRLIRTPRIAWSTAAATSVVMVALGIALLVRPVRQPDRAAEEDPHAYLNALVTDSVVQSLPSMSSLLASWKAGLTASEVPYEPLPTGGQ